MWLIVAIVLTWVTVMSVLIINVSEESKNRIMAFIEMVRKLIPLTTIAEAIKKKASDS